jgi:hypothetical protein
MGTKIAALFGSGILVPLNSFDAAKIGIISETSKHFAKFIFREGETSSIFHQPSSPLPLISLLSTPIFPLTTRESQARRKQT